MGIGAYFGLRRVFQRRRTAKAESPPSSPLLTSLALPSPLPSNGSQYYNPSLSSLSRGNSKASSYGGASSVFNEKDGVIQDQEVGYRGIMNTDGGAWPLSPLPQAALEQPKFSMIFPNNRQKLGGAPLPKDFWRVRVKKVIEIFINHIGSNNSLGRDISLCPLLFLAWNISRSHLLEDMFPSVNDYGREFIRTFLRVEIGWLHPMDHCWVSANTRKAVQSIFDGSLKTPLGW